MTIFKIIILYKCLIKTRGSGLWPLPHLSTTSTGTPPPRCGRGAVRHSKWAFLQTMWLVHFTYLHLIGLFYLLKQKKIPKCDITPWMWYQNTLLLHHSLQPNTICGDPSVATQGCAGGVVALGLWFRGLHILGQICNYGVDVFVK